MQKLLFPEGKRSHNNHQNVLVVRDLFFFDGLDRAFFDAGAAFFAGILVDHVFRIAFGYRVDGAYFRATAAHCAIISNHVRHGYLLTVVSFVTGAWNQALARIRELMRHPYYTRFTAFSQRSSHFSVANEGLHPLTQLLFFIQVQATNSMRGGNIPISSGVPCLRYASHGVQAVAAGSAQKETGE
jgi:hypothetical protein